MTDDCCLLLEQVRHTALVMRLKRKGCHSFDFTLSHTLIRRTVQEQLLTASNYVYDKELSER